jgi:putative peptidoglycan lipid II flippase
MVPIAVLGSVTRQPIVEILFGFGKITAPNLEVIAVTLSVFLIGLTAHSMIAVIARAFYARQDTVTPVAAAVGAVAVNCTLAALLVGPLGLPGIALAIAIATWGEALVLLAILRGRLVHFRLTGMARVGVESIVGSAIAGLAAWWLLERLGDALGRDPGRLVLVVELAVVSAAFAAVYALVSVALRIPELPSIVGVMVDVFRRPARS